MTHAVTVKTPPSAISPPAAATTEGCGEPVLCGSYPHRWKGCESCSLAEHLAQGICPRSEAPVSGESGFEQAFGKTAFGRELVSLQQNGTVFTPTCKENVRFSRGGAESRALLGFRGEFEVI